MPGDPDREQPALRERRSRLSEASLRSTRASVSDTMLAEAPDSARDPKYIFNESRVGYLHREAARRAGDNPRDTFRAAPKRLGGE